MTDCIMNLELARWEAKPEAERSPEVAAHLCTCDRCTAALAELVASRQELLGTDPQAQSLVAARAILERVAERRRRAWWRLVVPPDTHANFGGSNPLARDVTRRVLFGTSGAGQDLWCPEPRRGYCPF
jgi:anti-sigma factor RsiW